MADKFFVYINTEDAVTPPSEEELQELEDDLNRAVSDHSRMVIVLPPIVCSVEPLRFEDQEVCRMVVARNGGGK